MNRRASFVTILATTLLLASVGLAQCTLAEPSWDMAVPIRIIATSEVPEVERWRGALATAIRDAGGMPTEAAARQVVWLTSATYSWCDPGLNGAYVMYVMRAHADQPSAIFMCWRVISAGEWSDATIRRLMHHALGHVLASRLDDLPCELHAIMSPTSCWAGDGFAGDDAEYICGGGAVVNGMCGG